MHYIALLRAVNVGGTAVLRMAELRALGESLGLTGVATLLQSGNLVFDSTESDVAKLEQRWEAAVEQRFGVATTFMIRTLAGWQAMIAANPFEAAAKADPSHLVVLVGKQAIADAGVSALRTAIKGDEQVEPGERCVYAWYPAGIGTSKLTTKLIERHLGTPVTGRNWNTVVKLAGM